MKGISMEFKIHFKRKINSSKDFKRLFDNNFYVLLNPKSKEQKNPFGKLIGLEGEK